MSSAPIFSARDWRKNPMARIPEPRDLASLRDASPYWIPIFDSDAIFGGTFMPANTSAENQQKLTTDFAWLGNMVFTTFRFLGNSAFTVQFQTTYTDEQGNQTTTVYQKTPANVCAIGGCGMAENNVPGLQDSLPYYFRKPILLRAGMELQCKVTLGSIGFQTTNAAHIKFVLFGYRPGPAGGGQ